jgi:hypothetical protein
MERGLILYMARLIVTVCEPRQKKSANVGPEYVAGPDGYSR